MLELGSGTGVCGILAAKLGAMQVCWGSLTVCRATKSQGTLLACGMVSVVCAVWKRLCWGDTMCCKHCADRSFAYFYEQSVRSYLKFDIVDSSRQ